MTTPYRFPTDERFTCEGCTRCCRELPVAVTDAEVAVLAGVRNRHGVADPFATDPQGGRILLHVDGACVFLELDGRCAVHAQVGYAAKPGPCRKYPFYTVSDAERRYVRASFACPTVVAARGAGPDELAQAIERDVEPAPLPATYRLGAVELSSALYERLEAVLAEWLAQAPDLPRAIAGAGALLPQLEVADLDATLDRRAAPETRARLAAEARPFGARDARILLAPFLLLAAPTAQSRPSRALHAVRLLAGRGRFRTWVDAADVPLVAQATVRWPAALERPGGLLRRYLVHLVRSRAFLTGLSVEMQVNLVGVAYALVRWNARARAALAGRPEASEADLVTAVQDTDRDHFAHNATEARLLCNGWVGLWLDLMFRGPRRLAGLVLESS